VQDVVIDVEIVEKFKILEDKTNMGDAKLSSLGVIELIHGSIIHADVSPLSHNDTGDQVQQGGLAGTAGADEPQFFHSSQPKTPVFAARNFRWDTKTLNY
jgi:hypothetical protein